MRDSNGMHRESFTFTRTVLNGIEMVRGLYIREALRKTTMARITPIDVIKGISGKYGNGSSDYFATNSSSNRIHLAKYLNKPTGPATQNQLEQMQKFATQAKLASAWLRSNRPSTENGAKGTPAYQEAQALKRQLHLSNVRQVVVMYMDEEGNVTLPSTGTTTGGTTPPTDTDGGGSTGGTTPPTDTGEGGSTGGEEVYE